MQEGPKTTIMKEDGSKRDFTFDHSFWSHDGFKIEANGYRSPDPEAQARESGIQYCDQQAVYDCLGKEILDNAWEGYHCCLFAYGQTGSGKSYSMIGYDNNRGIVPLAYEEIFKRIADDPDGKEKYQVTVQMIEIYNEKIHDLMVKTRTREGLKVRESKGLGTYVDGITKIPVGCYEDIEKVMARGNKNRSIGATAMN